MAESIEKIKSTLKVTKSQEISAHEIKEYFRQFGEIEEIIVPNNKKQEVHIVFQSEEIRNELAKNPERTIRGKKVVVSKSTYLSDTMPKPPGQIVEEFEITGMSVQSFIDKYGS